MISRSKTLGFPAKDSPHLTISERAAEHLFANALADLLSAFDDVTDDDENQAAGPQAAQVPVTLDERHLGTGPPGRDGRRDAGRPAAYDQHVGLVEDRQCPFVASLGPPRLDSPSILP